MTDAEIDEHVRDGFANARDNEYSFSNAEELARDMATCHPVLEAVEPEDILASIIRLGLFITTGDA